MNFYTLYIISVTYRVLKSLKNCVMCKNIFVELLYKLHVLSVKGRVLKSLEKIAM